MFVKRLGSLTLIFGVFVVAMAVGEAVPVLKDLEHLIARHETVLLVVTIGSTVVGFVLFMGSVVVRIFGGAAEPMTATEVEDLSRSVRMEARPVLARVTRYRFRGRSAGASFSDRFTFREANGVKLLCAAALGYAAVRTVVGVVRA